MAGASKITSVVALTMNLGMTSDDIDIIRNHIKSQLPSHVGVIALLRDMGAVLLHVDE